MTGFAKATSKFGLTQLALRSAIELERARAGTPFKPEPLIALSEALLQTSDPHDDDAPFRFVEPGYYLPLQRLYRVQESATSTDVEHIQALIRRISESLAAAAKGRTNDTAALVDFCVALHQELIEELTAEDAFVVHEGRTLGDRAATGLSAA